MNWRHILGCQWIFSGLDVQAFSNNEHFWYLSFRCYASAWVKKQNAESWISECWKPHIDGSEQGTESWIHQCPRAHDGAWTNVESAAGKDSPWRTPMNCELQPRHWVMRPVPFAFHTLATLVCIKLLHPREMAWFCPSQGLSNSWSICLEWCCKYLKLSLTSYLSFWSQVIVFMSGSTFNLPSLYLLHMLWIYSA